MTIKREKHLDGIFVSERITVEPNPGEERPDPAELFQAVKSSALNLDHVLLTYETQARHALEARGFLTGAEDVRAAYLSCQTTGLDAITVDLLRILFMAAEVRANIANSDAARAAWNTIFLCRAAERAEIRPLELEKHLRRSYESESHGRKSGKKSGKVRAAKAEPTHEAWQREADKIWKRHPTWGKSAVAREVVKKIGGNVRTIRGSIQKPLP